jgi:hypothetical protein
MKDTGDGEMYNIEKCTDKLVKCMDWSFVVNQYDACMYWWSNA